MSDDPDETTDPQAILPFDDGSAGRLIRHVWHNDRWYFSVVDVIAVLTDSETPRRYWSDLKRKLQDDEGFDQLYAKIVQLKMRSLLDGKKYPTDAADVETMLRIVQSVPSPKAEPIKQWLAQEGARSLAELEENHRRLFLREEIAEKNRSLADTVTGAGIISQRDFAIFQDFGYKGLYNGETAHDIAARKGLARGQRILDHMVSEELAANWFRITQAEAKMRRDGVDNKADANRTHCSSALPPDGTSHSSPLILTNKHPKNSPFPIALGRGRVCFRYEVIG
jgi:DNA-damage-inducible protein D